MQSKRELLKELGWTEELIDAMVPEEDSSKDQKYDAFKGLEPLCIDSTTLIFNMEQTPLRSGKHLV